MSSVLGDKQKLEGQAQQQAVETEHLRQDLNEARTQYRDCAQQVNHKHISMLEIGHDLAAI